MKRLDLEYPVTIGEGSNIEKITFLDIRRAKAKDKRAFDSATESDGEFLYLATLTGQPVSVIEELDMKDMLKAQKVVSDFLGDGPSTGKTG